jgi:hemolysin activation/secretion protein
MASRFRSLALQACLGLLLPAIAGAQSPSAKSAQSIEVAAVRVEGNTLLPDATLARLTAGVAGTRQDLAALTALAARIQAAYREAGYGGVVAYLPQQASNDRTVVVRVVEGKLARVRVNGNRYFSSANVRAGLAHLREGTTPPVRAVDRDIQLTNSNSAKHVNVSLTAGAGPGDIDADVDVSDARPLQVLAGYNNTGTASTGRGRVSVGIEHANLFDLDHVGTLQYQTSPEQPGRVRIFSGGYRVPLYAQAASVDAFIAHSTVRNGTTATTAGPLSFTGRGTIAGLRVNRYLDRIGEYDHFLTLGLDRRDYQDDCSVGDFGAAACGPAAVSVTTMPLSLAYTGQKSGAALAYGFNAAVSVNLGGSAAPTFEAARPGSKRRYVLGRASAFIEKPLAAGITLNARMDLQYSAAALISAERFGIGGSASVRGYEERELNGDHGILLRLEAAWAGIAWPRGARLQPYLFVDHGRVENRGELPCLGLAATACRLSSAGAGARATLARRLGASLDVARALERGATTTPGRVRAHVALNLAY